MRSLTHGIVSPKLRKNKIREGVKTREQRKDFKTTLLGKENDTNFFYIHVFSMFPEGILFIQYLYVESLIEYIDEFPNEST